MQRKIIGTGAIVFAACCGCGSEQTGPAPEAGFNMEPISYESQPNPKAVMLQIPTVDPVDLPDPPLALPPPDVWKPLMPVDFAGEIVTPPNSNGTIVRVQIRPILSGGALGRRQISDVPVRLKERGANLRFLMNCWAPDKPGRYRVEVQTVGPSVDLEHMDTFAEGDIEVR
jgi:hypothetical protein